MSGFSEDDASSRRFHKAVVALGGAVERLGALTQNLLLAAVSLVAVLLLLEGLLFLAGFRLPETGYFLRDARLGFALRPGSYPGDVRVNADGFRGPELRQKEAGSVRIVALGDSCTFGVNVRKEEETYPRRLEKLLRSRGMDVEVVNAGVPGYTSEQGRLLLPRIERIQPDAVTVYYGWNDHWLAGFFTDRTLTSHPWILKLQSLAARSRVYQAMKRMLGSRPPRFDRASIGWPASLSGLLLNKQRYRVPLAQYHENLRAIVEWGKRRDVRVVLVTAPDGIAPGGLADPVYHRQGLIATRDSLASLHAAYNKEVRAVAEETGAPLVDAWRLLREHGNGFFADPIRDPVHPDARGHALIAEALAGRLADLETRPSETARRAEVVSAAIRRGVDWYLRTGGGMMCKKKALDVSDPKYVWFMLRVAELTQDFVLKDFLYRVIRSCAPVNGHFDLFREIMPHDIDIPDFHYRRDPYRGSHNAWMRWAVNCDRWRIDDRTRDTLFGTRYLIEHVGNRLNRKSYALTHMLIALIWLRDTQPIPAACVDPTLFVDRIHELASRLAWEQWTGLDNLGGYDGTRRREAHGRVRCAMQDVTGQRVGAILEAGYPQMVRRAWLDHLVSSQNPDGGWSASEGEPSSRHTTMTTLWALALARYTYPERFGYEAPHPRAASQ